MEKLTGKKTEAVDISDILTSVFINENQEVQLHIDRGFQFEGTRKSYSKIANPGESLVDVSAEEQAVKDAIEALFNKIVIE
jgi:hypothetical protein